MTHDLILAVHVLAAIVWIGFGFYELWLGRFFLETWNSSAAAPLVRFIHRSDLAAIIATMAVFLTGLGLAVLDFDRVTHELWLMLKLGIMTAVMGIVAFQLHATLDLGRRIDALPRGAGPVTEDIRDAYRHVEPWNLAMRLLAALAVLLSVFHPR
jgi:uncharacterized membrane protein